MTDAPENSGPEPKPDDPARWPSRAVLAFTRKELGIFLDLRPGAQWRPPIVSGITQIYSWPEALLAGPILGAPMAGMVLEILRRRGLKTFLSLGWCGALQPELTWGDIILPTGARSEEGTSAHYAVPGYEAAPHPDLANLLVQALTDRGERFTSGKIWTTDAPFRETRPIVRQHAASGLLAVDMETSAVMNVARFRQLSWAGLLVVSDELWGERWNPGFQSPELENGLIRAAEVILSVLEQV